MSEQLEIVVGVIGRAHGIRGDVVLDLRTDEPERRFAAGTQLKAEGSRRTFTVANIRDHSGRMLARFEELPDRTAAEQARGTVLLANIDADERPEDAEEFYDRQLVGLTARSATGEEIGTVTDVLHLPLQDSLEIKTPDGVRLVPFVEALVPTVDLAHGFLVVADVTGLLTDEDA
ncbi:MAG TPA: ribosome maturation factor RimM [Propionibacteriaceae bacterium]